MIKIHSFLLFLYHLVQRYNSRSFVNFLGKILHALLKIIIKQIIYAHDIFSEWIQKIGLFLNSVQKYNLYFFAFAWTKLFVFVWWKRKLTDMSEKIFSTLIVFMELFMVILISVVISLIFLCKLTSI